MIAAPAVVEALPVVQAPPGGLTLASGLAPAHVRFDIRHARLNVLEGTPVTVAGTLAPVLPWRIVTLQVLGRHGWHTVAHTRTGRRGRFALRYVLHRLLSRRVQVRFGGNVGGLAARRVLGHLRVYRLAAASWYGGGGSLACGGTLTIFTMGVANRTLPCGTFVTLRYGGRSVRVPVVDRGPFVAGREFDLTEATKRALGFEGVGEVWSSR